MERKRNSFSQRLFLGLIFVLVLAYTFYHMVSLFGESVETFAAGVTTERTVLSENGYVFRDETVLTSSYEGAVDHHTHSGVKVSKGQALATVYDGGRGARERIAGLDLQIALLEKSFGGSLDTLEMGALKKSVSDVYDELVKLMATEGTDGLSQRADELLVLLNQMKGLSQGEKAEGYATLASLKAQREQILEESGASITHYADASGYFYTEADGYESEFTMAAAEALMPDDFYELIEEMSDRRNSVDDAYGKISFSSEWVLVLPIDWSDREYFEEGVTYSAEFFQNNQTVLPLTLERIMEDPQRSSALLVFRSDRLPDGFSFDRCQSVRLEVDRVSGIYVPKDVVQRVDGLRGVYVLRGNVVYFRRIDITYEGSDYYLVKAGVEDADTPYLQVNDLIILNGKNMFDGRVLD